MKGRRSGFVRGKEKEVMGNTDQAVEQAKTIPFLV